MPKKSPQAKVHSLQKLPFYDEKTKIRHCLPFFRAIEFGA